MDDDLKFVKGYIPATDVWIEISISLAQPILPDPRNLCCIPILLAKSLSQLKHGYYCSHLSVCLSVLEKINVANSKVEYNSKHSSDLLQILNLSLGDKAK
jgi:hypothetical protein